MAERVTFGGIEAGGTKFVLGIGTGPEDLETHEIPTTTTDATTRLAVEYFQAQPRGRLRAVGIGSFGPLDLHRESSTFGYITSTPKAGWQNFDLAGAIGRALGVPVGIDTDVNAAAIGEARWGAARGVSSFIYLTVGTGIGGGAFVDGKVLHGLIHPEMGHIRIPHDPSRDPYVGCCPFHGDCLEGLASGPAIEARWGSPARDLPADHPAWTLEAHYLALGLATWVCTLSPERIVLGGGVMQQAGLLDSVRSELVRLLNGYILAPELLQNNATYVVSPQLGRCSGVLGAIALAERASELSATPP